MILFELLLSLIREETGKHRGRPFIMKKAVPLDLFPGTKYCEMVILFQRGKKVDEDESKADDVPIVQSESKNNDVPVEQSESKADDVTSVQSESKSNNVPVEQSESKPGGEIETK